jgi:hypothetical protein
LVMADSLGFWSGVEGDPESDIVGGRRWRRNKLDDLQ